MSWGAETKWNKDGKHRSYQYLLSNQMMSRLSPSDRVRRLRLDLGVLLCHFRFQLLDVFLRLFELRRQSLVPDRFLFSTVLINAHIMHILHRYYGICIVLFVKYHCIYLYFFKIILQFLYSLLITKPVHNGLHCMCRWCLSLHTPHCK